MIPWLLAVSLLMTPLSCLLNAALVFLPVFLGSLAVYLYVSGVDLSPGFTYQLGAAAYTYIGLFPPVSAGALAHGLLVSACRRRDWPELRGERATLGTLPRAAASTSCRGVSDF